MDIFSSTVTVTLRSGFVSASTSCAQRQPPTASPTDTNSTTHTYSRTFSGADRRARWLCSCSSSSATGCSGAAYSLRDRGWNVSGASSGAPAVSCGGSSIKRSARASSSFALRSRSSSDRPSRSPPVPSCGSFSSKSDIIPPIAPYRAQLTISCATRCAVSSPRSAARSARPNASALPMARPVMTTPSHTTPASCIKALPITASTPG